MHTLKKLTGILLRYFLVFILVFSTVFAGDKPGDPPGFSLFNMDSDDEATGPAIREDTALQNSLSNRYVEIQRNGKLSYKKAQDLVFVRLNPKYVRAKNQKTRNNLWRDYLSNSLGRDDVVVAYAEDGKTMYRMLYADEYSSGKGLEGIFNGSVVWGYVYEAGTFPCIKRNLLETLNDPGLESPLLVRGNSPIIVLRETKPHAIALVAHAGEGSERSNQIVLISMKNLNVSLKSWAREAMESAFIQNGLVDSGSNLDMEKSLSAVGGSLNTLKTQAKSYLSNKGARPAHSLKEQATALKEKLAANPDEFVMVRALLPGVNPEYRKFQEKLGELSALGSMNAAFPEKASDLLEQLQRLEQVLQSGFRSYARLRSAEVAEKGDIRFSLSFE